MNSALCSLKNEGTIMNCVSICMLCVVAALTAFVIYRAKQNDRLSAMTEPELLEESYWA